MRIIYCILIFIVVLISSKVTARNYDSLVRKINRGSIDSDYFIAMIMVESSNMPNIKSNKDCRGLMQVHYDTARDMGFTGDKKHLFIPTVNIVYGIKYMYWLYDRYKNHTDRLYKSFDAYNRGIGNVRQWPYTKDWRKHRYVSKVIEEYKKIKRKTK